MEMESTVKIRLDGFFFFGRSDETAGPIEEMEKWSPSRWFAQLLTGLCPGRPRHFLNKFCILCTSNNIKTGEIIGNNSVYCNNFIFGSDINLLKGLVQVNQWSNLCIVKLIVSVKPMNINVFDNSSSQFIVPTLV